MPNAAAGSGEQVSEEQILASLSDEEEPEVEEEGEPGQQEGGEDGEESSEDESESSEASEGDSTEEDPEASEGVQEGQEGAAQEAPSEGVAAAPPQFLNRISFLERELRRQQERGAQAQQFLRNLFEQVATPEERATLHQQEAMRLRQQHEQQQMAEAATQELDRMEAAYEAANKGFAGRCRAYEKQRVRIMKESGLDEGAAYQMLNQELAAVGGSARARGEDPIAAIDRYVTGNTRTGKPRASKKAAIAAREDRAAARIAASATAPAGTSGGSISDPLAKFLKKGDTGDHALARLFREMKGRDPDESGELSEFRFEVLASVVR